MTDAVTGLGLTPRQRKRSEVKARKSGAARRSFRLNLWGWILPVTLGVVLEVVVRVG